MATALCGGVILGSGSHPGIPCGANARRVPLLTAIVFLAGWAAVAQAPAAASFSLRRARLPAVPVLARADEPGARLPDAPEPQTPASSPTPMANPCPQPVSRGMYWRRRDRHAAIAGPLGEGVHPGIVPCQRKPLNAYQRFMNGPKPTELTPRDKAWLAARNVADPFNLITIAGDAAISIGLDSHSPYGPGMRGYGRYVGISMSEDITGEFIGTFLIPSVTHQDPHYHRMPGRPIPRRLLHAIAQVFYTQSDTGGGMLNYANLVGFAIEDEIGNSYVPGRATSLDATAARYAISVASAPIGNIVNEFLPDVASHIHVQIVVLQRIINQVARSATAGSTNGPSEFQGEEVGASGW